MTLQEFVIEERKRIDMFAAMWIESAESKPDENWPMDMPQEEWDECYILFSM